VEVVGERQQILDGAAEPVELPDDEGVAGAQVVEGRGQAGAVGLPGGDLLLEDAEASGGVQGVELELEVLLVGGDAGEADEGSGCRGGNPLRPPAAWPGATSDLDPVTVPNGEP